MNVSTIIVGSMSTIIVGSTEHQDNINKRQVIIVMDEIRSRLIQNRIKGELEI